MTGFYSLRDMRHYLLLPFALVYSLILYFRQWLVQKRGSQEKLSCPVVCVGNAVMGGAGKTPIVRALAHYFQKRGKQVHIISRGYGRRKSGNFLVQPYHTAYDVGDEALMLAKDFSVWVADDRFTAGKMAIADGADLILLDDGYQNVSLHKDVHILVTDMGFGYGNGFTFPAGCLREPLSMAFDRADCHILLQAEGEEALEGFAIPKKYAKDITKISAELSVIDGDKLAENSKAESWVAFCGLARCEKFFATVRKLAEQHNIHIMGYRPFRDHHFYSSSDKRELWGLAREYGALLVTTEKDFVRFTEAEQKDLSVVRVEVAWDEAELESFFNERNIL